MPETYLASFHGLDIGLVYNLPANVRVYMYCFPGKPISAEELNEARTWRIATLPEHDVHGKFMTQLFLRLDGPGKEVPYCVFSGNLLEEDMNRIPDLYFEEEEDGDFRTGLFHLPANFRRVFLKDHYSSVDHKAYQPGDVEELNRDVLQQRLAKPKGGFIHYFLEPSSLKKKRYKDLSFIVVPHSDGYESYNTLLKTKRIHSVPNKRIRHKGIDDKSVPNTHDAKESKRVQRIKKEMGGFYLSDLVRWLCARHDNNSFITIIVSACRCFHDDLPQNVRSNQKKTARVNAVTYYRNFAQKDVRGK